MKTLLQIPDHRRTGGQYVAGCMEFLAVTIETAPVNTGVDATFDVKIQVNKDIDIRTTPVVAILPPRREMAENAVVTYTTSDGSGTEGDA